MQLCAKILQIMNAQMETPTPYGLFHLICLVAMSAYTVAAVLRAKKDQDRGVCATLLVTSLAVMALEVYKQINFTFGDGSGAPEFQWYAFPFQFCSTPMYVGLLAGLIRKGKVHDALCAYLATFGLFAGLAVMLYPNTVFVGTVGINFQTMICHGSMVVIGVYLLASGHVKLEHRTILKAVPVFAVMVAMAACMNELAHVTGLLEAHTFNMFFISPYCEPSLPVYSLVQQVVPFPMSLVIYILGFTAAGYVMLLMAMILSGKHILKKAGEAKCAAHKHTGKAGI